MKYLTTIVVCLFIGVVIETRIYVFRLEHEISKILVLLQKQTSLDSGWERLQSEAILGLGCRVEKFEHRLLKQEQGFVAPIIDGKEDTNMSITNFWIETIDATNIYIR